MTTRDYFGIVLLLIVSLPVAALARDFPSPDGELIASVIAVNGESNAESRIEVRTRAGKILIEKSYASKDGEHGKIVERAEWAPDSQYFAYSMYSSGGHQPWHSPIDFFSRKTGSIVTLEKHVALIADAEFHLFDPGVIEVFGRRNISDGREAWFRVDLRQLR
jgi:hypothetical protein